MVTRRLFIEETTPGATGPGIRETFEPSESEMADLGWQRIPSTIPPARVVQPCLVHAECPSTLCEACVDWDFRDASPREARP